MKTLYERATAFLEEGERLIYPKMYMSTPWLYDKVSGVVYVIQNKDHPEEVDWIWERGLERAISNGAKVLLRLLLVRIREETSNLPNAIVISAEEYQKSRDRYDVLDICVTVVRKEYPFRTENLPVSTYQAFINDYEMIGVAYLVRTAYHLD